MSFDRDALKEAKNVFIALAQELECDVNQFPVKGLDFLDRVSAYKQYSSFKFIHKKDIMKEILKTKDKSENIITPEEFINWYTSNALKEILFQKTIDEQKYYIEDLTKLYYSLGGNNEGISKDHIQEYLKWYLKKYSVDIDLTKSTTKEIKSLDPENEAEEIMEYLAQDKDILTLEEFVNIMTCTTPDRLIGREELREHH